MFDLETDMFLCVLNGRTDEFFDKVNSHDVVVVIVVKQMPVIWDIIGEPTVRSYMNKLEKNTPSVKVT